MDIGLSHETLAKLPVVAVCTFQCGQARNGAAFSLCTAADHARAQKAHTPVHEILEIPRAMQQRLKLTFFAASFLRT